MIFRKKKAPTALLMKEASKADIDFILRQEAREEIGKWLLPATKQDHIARRRDPDYRYEMLFNDEEQPLGYAVIRGFENPHQSLELMRIVVATPGKGIGKPFLEKLVSRAFSEWGAHRFWLDLFEDNMHAEKLYRKVGFHPEGVLRDAVQKDGQWISLKIMSMIAPAT
jgi:diamine N-acetyltransferase